VSGVGPTRLSRYERNSEVRLRVRGCCIPVHSLVRVTLERRLARLELLRQQSRQLLEHAVLQQADILEGHPALSMMIPARLTAVLDCAELWVDEAMNGRVTLNAQAGRVATR
jgi:hypothetical protein